MAGWRNAGPLKGDDARDRDAASRAERASADARDKRLLDTDIPHR